MYFVFCCVAISTASLSDLDLMEGVCGIDCL